MGKLPLRARLATTIGGAAGKMSRLAGRGDGSVIGGVIGLRVEPDLLAFEENTAAGHMTTDYLALSPDATVGDAIDKLRQFEGSPETISTIFLVDANEVLVGAVPLVSLVLAPGGTKLSILAPDHVIFCEAGANEKEVAEMFDKYNLQTLPVVDQNERLTGVITADDVISLLRSKL